VTFPFTLRTGRARRAVGARRCFSSLLRIHCFVLHEREQQPPNQEMLRKVPILKAWMEQGATPTTETNEKEGV
jgi:hypothetical protein